MSGKGASKGAMELLLLQEKEQRYCNLCPRLCHHSCPVSNAERDEAVTPTNKNTWAGLVAKKSRILDELVADLFYKCLGCGQCTANCEHEIDLTSSLFSARGVAVSSGFEPPALVQAGDSFERFGNIWLEDLSLRIKDLVPLENRLSLKIKGKDKSSSAVPGRGLRIYWPGCSLLARRPELLSLTLQVCARLGEPDIQVYCGDETQCCGYPLLAAGKHQDFINHVERASENLEGADIIFTAAPECAWTFSVAWPRWAGIDPPAPEIFHVIDLLLPALKHAPVRAPLDLNLVYHDPCYLGRFLDRFEEPRKLLNSVVRHPVEEASWHGTNSYCCGAGGFFDLTSPDSARLITRARLGDLLGLTMGPPEDLSSKDECSLQSQEKIIATACPRCEMRFEEAGAKVLDIVEILALYLGFDKSSIRGGRFV